MKVTGLIPANGRPALCELCGGAIIWAAMEQGKPPVAADAQLNIAGNLVLWFEVDGVGLPVGDPPRQRAVIAPPDYTGPRWLAHMVSCPKASAWRRDRAQRGVL